VIETSKSDIKSPPNFLTLEDLLKGTEAEVTLVIPADRFKNLPNLAGKSIKIRPLNRQEYRFAAQLADKQGYTAAVNMMVFRSLVLPKLASDDQVDKAVGGIVDWLIENIHKISGMEIEEGGEEEKNSIGSPTPQTVKSTGTSS
jgi:hypothetical protein